MKHITRQQSVFSVRDIARAVKEIPHADECVAMVSKVLNDERLVKLCYTDGKESKYYTTKDVRAEEVQLFKLADEIRAQKNYSSARREQVKQAIAQ
ncbi:hypothetical protein [Orientia tsutsugamushi]|uniref:hypothetical protein n=1 Tax=Orientia tsutsugamushi TaxID=784 RepID=UPI000D5A3A8E|nr:conjugal transfer protein TraA [Orientia tsutsugamushi]